MNHTVKEAEYAPIRESADGNEDDTTSTPGLRHEQATFNYLASSRRSRTALVASALASVLFAILSIVLFLRIQRLQAAISDLQKLPAAPETDLKDARRYIEYEERVFSGLITLNKTSGTVYHHVPDGEPRFFGDPAVYPEIDQNWKHLLGSM